MTIFGKLELRKDHKLAQAKKFSISAMMQVLMCLLGQSKVFEDASEIFTEMVQLDVSGMQIQRVCEYHGSLLEQAIERNITTCIPQLKKVEKEEPVYVMVDGSMLYTRDKDWTEVKLGRIFNEKSNVNITEKRRCIMDSIFVSHMGSVDEFFPKFERYLPKYQNKVIIGDGGRWIWKWADDNYPRAIQILDFYHAKDKLVLFAKAHFKDPIKRKEWVDEQLEALLKNGVDLVVERVQKLKPRNEEAKELKAKLINYYQEHEDRMQYKTYKDKGLLIGSGPIEAAHRSVLQSRMKLSGQKWSIDGANAIANLRCYKESKAWHIVETIVKVA